jgi:hypothetical protein
MPRPASLPISIIAHPPERGRSRSLAPAQAGASCCCCCCCLHSVGAVIGAAIAPIYGRRPAKPTQEEEDYADFPRALAGGSENRMSAVSLFWLSNLALAGLFVVGSGIIAGVNGNADFAANLFMAGLGLVMLLPALLLVAAAVAGFILAVSSRPDKMYQIGRLGRITLGTVIGTVAGTLPMVCLFYAIK